MFIKVCYCSIRYYAVKKECMESSTVITAAELVIQPTATNNDLNQENIFTSSSKFVFSFRLYNIRGI